MESEGPDVNVGVYCVVACEGEFLMVSRGEFLGLLGGRLKKGESLLEGLARELKEEVGLEPEHVTSTGLNQVFESRRYDEAHEDVEEGFEEHYFYFTEFESRDKVKGGSEEHVWVEPERMVESPFPDRERVKRKILKLYRKGRLGF